MTLQERLDCYRSADTFSGTILDDLNERKWEVCKARRFPTVYEDRDQGAYRVELATDVQHPASSGAGDMTGCRGSSNPVTADG